MPRIQNYGHGHAMPPCCKPRAQPPGVGTIALDGEMLRGSFDNFNDRVAAMVLMSAFATDTSLVLARVDIDDWYDHVVGIIRVERGVLTRSSKTGLRRPCQRDRLPQIEQAARRARAAAAIRAR